MFNPIKFAELLKNLKFPHIREHEDIEKGVFFAREFLDLWYEVVDVRGFDPRLDVEPGALEEPWLIFTYWWLKAWAEAKNMSLDQLDMIKVLADKEYEWLSRHPRGSMASKVSFVYAIEAQINNAIAVAIAEAVLKKVLIRNGLSAAECEAAALPAMVADLPDGWKRVQGQALLKGLEDARLRMVPTGH